MDRSYRYAPTLVVVALALACGAQIGWQQQTPSSAPATTPVEEAATPATSAHNTPWASTERSTRVEERQGEPVHLQPGERCTSYRRLPSLSYGVSTLVLDACLEITGGTTVDVRDGATLVIVATNGLRVGAEVKLNARGAGGDRGARAPFATVRRDVDSDAEINALCVEHGNQCGCPTSTAQLQGRPGRPGAAGGSVQLIAAELVLVDKVNGFAIDVSGGAGGPPGDSGQQECRRGEIHCSSPVCSGGAAFGAPGSTGKVVVALGGGTNAAGVSRLIARAVPPGALSVTEVGTPLSDRAAELDREAMQKGWQRLVGRSL